MTVTYQGKKPGKIWTTTQKIKGIIATRKSNQKTVAQLAQSTRNTTLGAGGVVMTTKFAGLAVTYMPFIAGGLVALGAYDIVQSMRGKKTSVTGKKKNTDQSKARKVSGLGAIGLGAALFVFAPTTMSWLMAGAIGATGYFGYKSFVTYKAAANNTHVKSYIREQEQKWLENKQRPSLFKRMKAKLARATSYAGFTTAGAGLASLGALAYSLTIKSPLSMSMASVLSTSASSIAAYTGIATTTALGALTVGSGLAAVGMTYLGVKYGWKAKRYADGIKREARKQDILNKTPEDVAPASATQENVSTAPQTQYTAPIEKAAVEQDNHASKAFDQPSRKERMQQNTATGKAIQRKSRKERLAERKNG